MWICLQPMWPFLTRMAPWNCAGTRGMGRSVKWVFVWKVGVFLHRMAEGSLRVALDLQQALWWFMYCCRWFNQKLWGTVFNCQCLTTVFVFHACLLTEWWATHIYFPQPPWQVWSFKEKINQPWQFFAVLFHIILIAAASDEIWCPGKQLYIEAVFLSVRCNQVFSFLFPLPWLTSFSCTSSEPRQKNENVFA